jgi:hypothetical protein
MPESEIKIYQLADAQTDVQVKFEDETVWLSQRQMAQLFDKDADTIGVHLKNIYNSEELNEPSTTEESSVVQLEGTRNVKRKVKFYNLDAIISVGYRVNSTRGIQFRIWANKILKEFLIKGYALNEKRLAQQNEQLKKLQESVKILGKVINYKPLSNDESVGLLKIISDYAYALDILDQYDYQKLEIRNTSGKETYRLSYDEAIDKNSVVAKNATC